MSSLEDQKMKPYVEKISRFIKKKFFADPILESMYTPKYKGLF